jgi:protoporphyrinogen oxidase
MEQKQERQFVIIGAGPAGLTAGYELTKQSQRPILLEQYDKVGGLARTENYKGYHFDMGGHRFFTKSEPVNQMWHEVLGDDFLRRPRLSRIFYQDKFFYYPLKIWNALSQLGLWQAILIGFSFIYWQIFPYKKEETFEQWVTNRFGKQLFEIFFKTYTEKVWGIPCSELKAEWAAQRIKNLSLKTALLSMIIKPGDSITSLIEEFNYPRLGPGMLWTEVKNQIETHGGEVHLNSPVVRIHRTGNHIDSIVVSQEGAGEHVIHGTDFISSMPVSEFVKKIDPVPAEVLQAANKLNYRDFLTVCLIVNRDELFPDNWIYIHSPEVKVGRIQNFKNWSPDMVPDLSKTSLGMEYFCTKGDDFWNTPDTELIKLAKQELERIGLANADEVIDGCVFRVENAYPVYDAEYADYLKIVRDFVDGLSNFQTIGRNGLHRYNNQDHSMITGTLAVRNLLFGETNDLWNVNADAEYHEEIRTDGKKTTTETLKEKITHSFPRLDPVAFGFSLGTTLGVLTFIVTLLLFIRDGGAGGTHLALLSNFIPGFTVTVSGAMMILPRLFLLGFIFGSGFAYLRNLAVYLGARIIHRDIELYRLKRLFDFV